MRAEISLALKVAISAIHDVISCMAIYRRIWISKARLSWCVNGDALAG